MSQITTTADIIPTLINFINSLVGVVETGVGAVTESRSANTAATQQRAKIDKVQAAPSLTPEKAHQWFVRAP